MTFKKGHTTNVGRKRLPFSLETRKKMGLAHEGMVDEKSPSWKGDLAKKNAIHIWVVKKLGFANLHKCIDCGKQAQHWSNKDHTYKRILEDYQPRCRKCHSIFDKIWLKRERNSKGQFMGTNKQKPLL